MSTRRYDLSQRARPLGLANSRFASRRYAVWIRKPRRPSGKPAEPTGRFCQSS